MRGRIFLASFIGILMVAWPQGVSAQTTPPTVTFTTPAGIQRGTTGTFVIEGTDLAGTTGMVFSEPGLTGKILSVSEVPQSRVALEPKVVRSSRPYFDEPAKVQATVEIRSDSWMASNKMKPLSAQR